MTWHCFCLLLSSLLFFFLSPSSLTSVLIGPLCCSQGLLDSCFLTYMNLETVLTHSFKYSLPFSTSSRPSPLPLSSPCSALFADNFPGILFKIYQVLPSASLSSFSHGLSFSAGMFDSSQRQLLPCTGRKERRWVLK